MSLPVNTVCTEFIFLKPHAMGSVNASKADSSSCKVSWKQMEGILHHKAAKRRGLRADKQNRLEDAAQHTRTSNVSPTSMLHRFQVFKKLNGEHTVDQEEESARENKYFADLLCGDPLDEFPRDDCPSLADPSLVEPIFTLWTPRQPELLLTFLSWPTTKHQDQMVLRSTCQISSTS